MNDNKSSKNANEMDGNIVNPKVTSTHPTILIGKLNGRQSSPDSEALISSDDEADRLEQAQPASYQESQLRRASWMNGSSPIITQPRKASFASSSMSPTTSQPGTPSADPSIWSNQYTNNGGFTRGHQVPSTFPWGNGIWNNDTRKEPPSRLTEVLPSPKALASPLSPGIGFNGDLGSINRDQSTNPQIPFAIPLHPTPKTYRSQSYSVGQLDLDSPASAISHTGIIPSSRGRQIQHSGLLHRPSRPSMLSEISNENFLCNLEEIEDFDENNDNNPGQGTYFQSNQAKTIEKLTRENANLRQQYKDSCSRPRSSTSNLTNYGFQNTHLEKSDSAIDEFDETSEHYQDVSKRSLARKFSEYRAKNSSQLSNLIQNRKVENVKKGFWQSSLGFGGLEDIPQSRRHSFATIPTRNNTVPSIAEPLMTHDNTFQERNSSKEFSSKYQDQSSQSLNEHIKAYFGGILSFSQNSDIYNNTGHKQQPAYPFTPKNSLSGTRALSPQRSIHGSSQIRINQPLYIVLFKCSRSDIFYIQEGTGLSVKPGDLVIVEADRGTDLGTVARANIDWATAKELKEYYSVEHYKWLMMYSKGASRALDGTGAGLMATSSNLQRSTIGGMGPPSQHGTQDPNSNDIKPKIIKRLAQKHEVQALREKEGNEAKAKRVCTQKVREHGLHMEILDAEFQMDWKKLTFYYFADAYINFNSLVTDLFKAYKTRIWMSAINPASFANPVVGFLSPNGIEPSVVYGVCPIRTKAPDKQHQKPPLHTIGRGYQIPYAQQLPHSLDNSLTSYLPSPAPYNIKFSPFFGTIHDTPAGFSPVESFVNGSALPEFQEHPSQISSLHGPMTSHKEFTYRREPMYAPSKDTWINSFHGLSMNSR